MHEMFKNAIAIVTGAASGFGFAISKKLLDYGAAAVWLMDFNALKLAEAQKQLNEEFPGRVFSKRVDISVKGEIEAAVDEACRVSGRIDMLFNNAGRPMTFPTSHINPDDFRKLVDLNYIGVAMGTLKVLPMMEKAGKGYVINAASMGGLLPFPYQAAYASTKAAVISFTQCLAYEYDGTDIHFMQYSPTNVATNIFFAQQAEEMRKAGKTEEEIAEAAKNTLPPEGALRLDDAIDILFEGIEKGETNIIIGDDSKLYEMYCTNRQAFSEIALEIGAKRRAFFNRALECAALGLPPDVPFPG